MFKYKIIGQKISILFIFIYIYLCLPNILLTKVNLDKKRIGVINLPNFKNVGNILVKFAMFKKLEELGFNVTIITQKSINPYKSIDDISFLNKTINIHLLLLKNDFSELKENDYDYIFVNSDQTWAYFNKTYFYDIAFLKFAEKWKLPKFIYGASIGHNNWFYRKEEEEVAKKLLKNFTGISFREKRTVDLAEEHLGIKGILVLDPTLLIDKKYYINEIIDYKNNFNIDEKYIFIYKLYQNKKIEKIITYLSKKLNYKLFSVNLQKHDYIESFIFGIKNCQAVITDSFHGTIFSIIFNKPFISITNKKIGKGRFDSLREIFNLGDRIIEDTNIRNININLLLQPLNINQTLLNELKNLSIKFLKKHLDIL